MARIHRTEGIGVLADFVQSGWGIFDTLCFGYLRVGEKRPLAADHIAHSHNGGGNFHPEIALLGRLYHILQIVEAPFLTREFVRLKELAVVEHRAFARLHINHDAVEAVLHCFVQSGIDALLVLHPVEVRGSINPHHHRLLPYGVSRGNVVAVNGVLDFRGIPSGGVLLVTARLYLLFGAGRHKGGGQSCREQQCKYAFFHHFLILSSFSALSIPLLMSSQR